MSKKTIKGFTLVEILISISIIAILMAISVFGVQGARTSARDSKRKADLETIRAGLELYKADCGNYPAATYTSFSTWPSTLSGDDTPVNCDSDNDYLVTPKDPLDSSRYYKYSSAGTTYCLATSLEGGSGNVTCGGNTTCGTTCNYMVNNP